MATQESFLRIRGFLREDLTYIPLPGWETSRLHKRRQSQGNGSIAIRLLDHAGNELFEHRFSFGFVGACSPGQIGLRAANVFEAVPLIESARSLEIRAGERLLHKAAIPNRAPEVRIRSCEPLQKKPGTYAVEIEVAAEPEAKLSCVVAYRPAAKQLYPVAEQTLKGPQAALEVDLTGLPGSKGGSIVVNVSDGVRSSYASSQPITVDSPSPEVHLIRPFESESFRFSQPIALSGLAVMPWGPSLDDSGLTWRVDGREIDKGTRDAACEGLEPGVHEVELDWSGSLPGGTKASVAKRVKFTVAPPSKEESHWLQWFDQIQQVEEFEGRRR